MCLFAAVRAARPAAPPELIKRFEEQIAKNGLDKEVKVVRTGCFGLCEAGPVVIVYPEGTFYSRVKVEDVDEIVSEHLLKGRIVQHLIYMETWRTRQQQSTLERYRLLPSAACVWLCGTAVVIDPENIDEYIAFDGYHGPGQGADRNDPRAGHRGSAEAPACAAAAALVSPPG